MATYQPNGYDDFQDAWAHGWDVPPGPAAGSGSGHQGGGRSISEGLIRELITALGASTVNTNAQVGQLTQVIGAAIHHGGFGAVAGGRDNDHGYRLL